MPKGIIKRLESMCRNFLWTGKEGTFRRAPIAWSKICEPKRQGGLNVFDLERWNKACLSKLLWDLCKKNDSLWVRWIHSYYIKQDQVMTVKVKPSCSWMLRAILNQRENLEGMQAWNAQMCARKFCKKKIYNGLLKNAETVPWRKIFYDNEARPRVVFITWLVCHGRLATKDRLKRFGILDNDNCVLCAGTETLNHLLFECNKMHDSWRETLNWMQMEHTPQNWEHELQWISHMSKKKSWKTRLLKTAFVETVYACWSYRNAIVYRADDRDRNRNIHNEIIDTIVHRIWRKPSLREKIAPFLL
ncbi:uncharacterized protein LOC131620196 [Vicia villosa]|uniref:uncharacterized protein LOC131620196 n=1 Tax=Vicia villosa TaxID=3911 RepID=UPI00273B4E29|nr:uncharacterized protein LOC131620196 [Vicia villosa]